MLFYALPCLVLSVATLTRADNHTCGSFVIPLATAGGYPSCSTHCLTVAAKNSPCQALCDTRDSPTSVLDNQARLKCACSDKHFQEHLAPCLNSCGSEALDQLAHEFNHFCPLKPTNVQFNPGKFRGYVGGASNLNTPQSARWATAVALTVISGIVVR